MSMGDSEPSRVASYLHEVDHIHTCEYCNRIVISRNMSKSLRSWSESNKGDPTIYMVRLPHTRSEARSAASAGCPLLQSVVHAIDAGTTTQAILATIQSMLLPWQPNLARYPYHLSDEYIPVGEALPRKRLSFKIYLKRAVYLSQHLMRQHLYISVLHNVVSFHYLSWQDYQKEVALFTPDESVSVEHIHTYATNPYISSKASIQKAKTWIQQCHDLHDMCKLEPSSFMPSRLIKIENDNEGTHIRMTEGHSPTKVQWCALSYVWGGDQVLKLTVNSAAALRKGISLAELPLTIHDAVLATQALGIEYIWIDALCILQDDADDLNRELATMPDIYQRACVTICASSAATVNDGFLQDRKYYYESTPPVRVRYRASSNSEQSLVLAERTSDYVPEPIDGRAWTYQEKLLSVRRLNFTTRQLKWTCRTLFDSDGGTETRILDEIGLGGLNNPSYPCLPGQPLPRWNAVVENFCLGGLTQPKDKLIAISAIAEVYRKSSGRTYLAGLWREDLPYALCWYRRQTQTPQPRPPLYRAPSWSWASVEGSVTWSFNAIADLDFYGAQNEAKIIKTDVIQDPPNTTFGSIISGRLEIEGKVRSAGLKEDGSVEVDGQHIVTVMDAQGERERIEESPSREIIVFLAVCLHPKETYWMPVESLGLLLRQCGAQTYQRIGFVLSLGGHKGHDKMTCYSDWQTRRIEVI